MEILELRYSSYGTKNSPAGLNNELETVEKRISEFDTEQ